MSNRHRNLTMMGGLARLLARTVRIWPVILIASFFYFEQGPHLRVTWTCSGPCERNIYIDCTYLGSRGFIEALGPYCPLFAWIDTRGLGL